MVGKNRPFFLAIQSGFAGYNSAFPFHFRGAIIVTQAHRIPEEATPELPAASAQASKRLGIRESGERPMFDTLQVVRDLKKGGFSEPQAEAVVSAFNAISQNMVTRAELKAELKAALENYPTKAELKAALADYSTKADLKSELATLETRLTVRMLMMSGLIVGAVALIVKL